jgi:hypothetical protein
MTWINHRGEARAYFAGSSSAALTVCGDRALVLRKLAGLDLAMSSRSPGVAEPACCIDIESRGGKR